MNKSFELQIEDPKFNVKIEAMANEWQITPDEAVSLIIKLSIGQMFEDMQGVKL